MAAVAVPSSYKKRRTDPPQVQIVPQLSILKDTKKKSGANISEDKEEDSCSAFAMLAMVAERELPLRKKKRVY